MTVPGALAEDASLPAVLDRLAGWSPGEEDLEAAWLRVADAACAVRLGSTLAEWGSARRALARDSGATASPGGRGPVAPASGTAVALAACCRITEVDDIELATCTTPGSVVVPAALATLALGGAAASGALADDGVLAAVATGYEVVLAAATLLGGAFAPAAGVWPTRAVAALGAAATATRVLGLTPEIGRHAAALAAGAASAGTSPEPARSWSLGVAVGRGVAAALAAAEGLRGDGALLARWPAGVYGGSHPAQVARVAAALRTGTSAVRRSRLKPYAGARQVLAGSAMLRALVETGEVDPGDVATVLLEVPAAHAGMVDRPLLQVRLDTLASAQYQLAMALEAPHHLDELEHPLPPPAPVAARMGTVHVAGDDGPTAGGGAGEDFPARWGARLELVRDGHGRTRHVATSVPDEDAFGWEDVEGKARRLAAASRGGGASRGGNVSTVDRSTTVGTADGAGLGDVDELLATVRRRDWDRLTAVLVACAVRDDGGVR